MKTKFVCSLLFVIALSLASFAQSVVVTPRKVNYKRPKPMSDYKKSFVITYPKVKASTPALSRKIEQSISYEKNSGLILKEELNDIQWLEEAEYEVNYNKNGLLDITLSISGSGAYPSSSSKTVVVDLKTGNQVTPTNVFTNLSGLAAMVKKAQQKEIKESIIEIKKDDPETENPAALFEGKEVTVENLNEFSVKDDGVTFIYDYGFPHVILALQPDGRFFYSWAELKPYIKKGSVFEKFVK